MLRHTTTWLCLLALAGCGSASAETTATPATTTGAQQKTATSTRNEPAASIEPIEDDTLTEEERQELQIEWRERLIAPYVVEDEDAPAIEILDGTFEDSERFLIRGVPAGATFHPVNDSPPTWEVRRDGQRIALIQEEEWSEVMRPEMAPEQTAPLRAPAAGQVHELDDWGGQPATIVAQQYVTPLRLFRVERLEEGTDWIVRGFEYTPPDPLPNVGD